MSLQSLMASTTSISVPNLLASFGQTYQDWVKRDDRFWRKKTKEVGKNPRCFFLIVLKKDWDFFCRYKFWGLKIAKKN